jgi:membrane dipeptidase
MSTSNGIIAPKNGEEIDYRATHDRHTVVDGHCDLVTEIYRRHKKGQRALFLNEFAEELKTGGVNVVMLSTGGDGPSQNIGSDDYLWSTLTRIQSVLRENEESCEVISLCTSTKDMEHALTSGKIALFMMIEGARPLRDQLGLIDLYYRLGVRSIQLTWNGRNLVGDGCGESQTAGGLTRFGKAVVKEMNRMGMVVDLSHASEATFYSAVEVSEDPVIVSHANARAVHDHVRNLTDEQIKVLAQQGGVIGVCFFPVFIDKENPSLEKLLDHVDHIAELVGTESISLGPDFIDFALDIFLPNLKNAGEGGGYGTEFTFPEEISSTKNMPCFTEGLVKRGYSEDDIANILGRNLLRVYRQVIG